MNPIQCIGKYKFSNINYTFKIYELEHNVISCKEAAQAKGINLKNELKTLVLETSNGLCTVNISAENQISLRQVKSFLKVKEAHLTSEYNLNRLQLVPGAVCPFLQQLWSLPMLIDEELFKLSFVSTNNGTRNRFIIFPPDLLLLSPNHIVGSFSVLH